METKEKYVPSSEEVRKAEEMMTDEQKKASEERGHTYEAGYEKSKEKNDEQKESEKNPESQEIIVEYLSKQKSLLESLIKKNGGRNKELEGHFKMILRGIRSLRASSVENFESLWDIKVFQNKSISDVKDEFKKVFRLPTKAETIRLIYEEVIPINAKVITTEEDKYDRLISFGLYCLNEEVMKKAIENKKESPEKNVFGICTHFYTTHGNRETISEAIRLMSNNAGDYWYASNETEVSHLVLLKDK